ncbi:MAG: flagellar protein FlaG [Candidatus Latescibacteria bacterium]|nr:flagellar protein FlaG [Candidatus Latescibacterota bacterium]
MKIESRLTDNKQLQMSSGDNSVKSRRKIATSDPSGESSKAQVSSNIVKTQSAEGKRRIDASFEIQDFKKAVEILSKLVRSQQRDVTFSVDEDADATVIKVTKTETGELIKQFPPEEILAMIARLRKNIGWLVDKKA